MGMSMDDRRISFAAYDVNGNVAKAWSEIPDLDPRSAMITGSDRADELIDYLKASDNRPMFARVMREVASAGKTAAAIGFMERIAERLRLIAPAVALMFIGVGIEA